jgi:DNA-binding response OmpR family regulator
MALSGKFDIILLDLMLPGLDGLSVCRKIREQDSSIPILMLTAKSDEVDKIVGLEIGADDYITKPFSIRELIARIRAALRRRDTNREDAPDSSTRTERCFGPLCIDLERRLAHSAGRKLELTAKEFDLLAALSEHPGKAFTRQELLEQVWGYQYQGYSHTVNSHINRLRSKIETDPTHPLIIETVWGYGYRLAGGNVDGRKEEAD